MDAPKTESNIALTGETASDLKSPKWYVSLSFGKSRSKSYLPAVALAKKAPQYLEHETDGTFMHQAIYSDKPNEYLQFVKLYELVSGWKSCFVIINGLHVDRKTVGGLNYCYGDKCRSGNPDFCYGASPLTENPFGCHRFQTSAWNNPWWTYGVLDRLGVWRVDKEAILKRMAEYAEPYFLCPAFSWDRALAGLERLPDTINPRKDSEWVYGAGGVTPKSRSLVASYTINVELDPATRKKLLPPSKASGCGCATLPVVLVVIGFLGWLLSRS